jgi:hypothetical protein
VPCDARRQTAGGVACAVRAAAKNRCRIALAHILCVTPACPGTLALLAAKATESRPVALHSTVPRQLPAAARVTCGRRHCQRVSERSQSPAFTGIVADEHGEKAWRSRDRGRSRSRKSHERRHFRPRRLRRTTDLDSNAACHSRGSSMRTARSDPSVLGVEGSGRRCHVGIGGADALNQSGRERPPRNRPRNELLSIHSNHPVLSSTYALARTMRIKSRSDTAFAPC